MQILTAVLIFAAGSVLPGCVEQLIPVRTTTGQVDRGFPDKMTVASAPKARARYVAGENAFLSELDSNIEDGQETVAFIGGVVQTATSPEGLAAFGFTPLTGGGSLLTFLGGLALKRRRDVNPSELAAEKRDSYNKGVEVTKALIELKETV